MGQAGLGLRLYDILYDGDTHNVFDKWWDYALREYVPVLGDPTLGATQYYDPLIDYHQPAPPAMFGVSLARSLSGQKHEHAEQLYRISAKGNGWLSEKPLELKTDGLSDRLRDGVLRGFAIGSWGAAEFGLDEVYDRLRSYADNHFEPTWSMDSGEFFWGMGLNEEHPRGQLNGIMMMAEVASRKGLWKIVNEPNFNKYNEPTVHSVDFPTVCLSQAWYDSNTQKLIVATDSGLPGSAGNPTSFRIGNVDPSRCKVLADDEVYTDWRVVDGEIEINTTVGAHTFTIAVASDK